MPNVEKFSPYPTTRIGLLGIVAAVLVLNACLTFGDYPHPSDAELIQSFAANRATLEEILQMCEEDTQMGRIAFDFTWKTDNFAWPRPDSELGITKERWNKYRELFTKAGIRSGVVNHQPESVIFLVNTQGLVTGGSAKGYVYLQKPPEHLQQSLDNFNFKNSDSDDLIAYRHVEGNWYLFYEVS